MRLLAAALAACLLWLPATPANAELAVRVKPAGAIEGQPGYFDVAFEVSEGTFDLAAYMIELNLSGPTGGVRFTHFAEPNHAVFPGRIAPDPQFVKKPPDLPTDSAEDPQKNSIGTARRVN